MRLQFNKLRISNDPARINELKCGHGGIGRRKGLKILLRFTADAANVQKPRLSAGVFLLQKYTACAVQLETKR